MFYIVGVGGGEGGNLKLFYIDFGIAFITLWRLL